MLVHCPDCGLIFRVGASQMAAAGGQVLCKECHTTFMAPAHQLGAALVPDEQGKPANEDLSADGGVNEVTDRMHRIAANDHARIRYTGTVPVSRVVPPTLSSEPSPVPPTALVQEHTVPEALVLAAPLAEASADVTVTTGRKVPDQFWTGGVIFMGCMLFWQAIAVPGSQWMATSPTLVAIGGAVCGAIGCKPPVARLPQFIKLQTQAVVGSHPAVAGALLVRLTLVNAAPVRQVFPVIELTLFDQASQVVGRRRFHPKDYLDTGQAEGEGLQAGAVAMVNMELAATTVPPERYEFRFM